MGGAQAADCGDVPKGREGGGFLVIAFNKLTLAPPVERRLDGHRYNALHSKSPVSSYDMVILYTYSSSKVRKNNVKK